MKRLSFKLSPRVRTLTMAAVLASAAAIVAGRAWLSLEFMKDPRSLVWLNRYLPDAAKIPVSAWDDPKTIAEIESDLRKSGLAAGEPILINMTLKSQQKINDLLLPIFRFSANGDNLRLVEMRVYRTVYNVTARKKEAFQFVNKLTLQELEETFAIDPLIQAKTANTKSNGTLPFTTVQRYESGAPNNGIWISAIGRLQRGDAQIAYGEIIYYNPTSTLINAVLPWTSTTNELPGWQSVAKGRPPQLVVNQTVGLEPDLQTYQLRTVRQGRSISVQLQPISITKPAIKNGTFNQALFLARNGLWSPALETMKSVRQNNPSDWTIAAQTQMDLIDRHAKITEAQADQPAAAPSQQILANLIDGRWTRAAQLLQPADEFEVLMLLKTDAGRIQKRINAALSLNNARSDVQFWAALQRAAKQGKSSAIAWLAKQPQDSARIRAQTLQILNNLDSTVLSTLTQPTLSPRAQSKKN